MPHHNTTVTKQQQQDPPMNSDAPSGHQNDARVPHFHAPPPPPPHMGYNHPPPHQMWHPADMNYRMEYMGYSAGGYFPPPHPAHNMGISQKRDVSPSGAAAQHHAVEGELERSKREASNEAEAASALLMAAASRTPNTKPNSSPLTVSSAGPLKKRKKMDVTPRNCGVTPSVGTAVLPACQVSPTSTTSSPATPASTPNIQATSSATDSYGELKDGQALTDSAKICDTAEITPMDKAPPYPIVPDFPTVLHSVLNEAKGNVLQWLSHGQSWRIVRWGALRKEILPKHFPSLCQQEEVGSGSNDAFIFNVQAWGFEEVIDGDDAGAYKHKLFLRDSPELCEEMKCLVVISPSGKSSPHNLLRVPSLATASTSYSEAGGDKDLSASPSNKSGTSYPSRREDDVSRESPLVWGGPGEGYDRYPPIHEGYHPDARMMGPPHYPTFSPLAMQNTVSCPPPYDARYPFRPHPESMMPPPLPAPQVVRSNRGSARVVGRSVGDSSAVKASQGSFYVSQRGKGLRGPGALRTPLPAHKNEAAGMEEEVSTGIKHLEKKVEAAGNVARTSILLARKTKMKLPLSRSRQSPTEE